MPITQRAKTDGATFDHTSFYLSNECHRVAMRRLAIYPRWES